VGKVKKDRDAGEVGSRWLCIADEEHVRMVLDRVSSGVMEIQIDLV
jgi:hypothetical protein